MSGARTDSDTSTINSVVDAVRLLSLDEGPLPVDASGPNSGLEEVLKRMRTHGNAAGFGLWFRGQPRADQILSPTLFRNDKYYVERTLFLQFQGTVGHSRECRTIFDWLSLMRHHHLPSRLLDWSENLLTALFFAVGADERDDDTPGRLFILDAHMLNRASEGVYGMFSPGYASVVLRAEMTLADDLDIILERLAQGDCDLGRAESNRLLGKLTGNDHEKELRQLAHPVAVFPTRVDPRMSTQQSVFTIHGGKKRLPRSPYSSGSRLPAPVSFDELQSRSKSSEKFLFSFLVGNKARIRRELRHLGVNESSLFPDLDHQAMHLAKTWNEDTKSKGNQVPPKS